MSLWERRLLLLPLSAWVLALGPASARSGLTASAAEDSWWEGTVTYTLTAPGVTSESSNGKEAQEYTFVVAGRIGAPGTASASLKASYEERDYNCHVQGTDVFDKADADLTGDLVGEFRITQSGAEYNLDVPAVDTRGSKAYVRVVSGCKTEPGTETIKVPVGPQDDLLHGTGNPATDDELSGTVTSETCWPHAWLSTRRWLLDGCTRTVTWSLKRTKKDCNKDRRSAAQKTMKASESIRKYIENIEKRVPYMYNDDDPKWKNKTPSANADCTVGYGHKLHDGPCTFDGTEPSEKPYYEGTPSNPILNWVEETEPDPLDALFAQDLKDKENYLNRVLRVPLTQDQFDALLDFVFNAGSLPDLSLWAGKSKQCAKYSSTNPRCQDVLFQINCGVLDDVFGKRGGKDVGLSRFVRPGTKFEDGLRQRRADEEKLWNGVGGNALLALEGSVPRAQGAGRPPRPKPPPRVGPRDARVSVSPGSVRAGEVATVRGIRFGLRKHGCEPTVTLEAFVPGVSPYRAVRLGRVPIGDSRSFTRTWKTTRYDLRFRWAVVAFQKCEGKTMQRRATVLVR